MRKGLFSLGKGRLKGDPITVFKYMKGGYKDNGDKLFSVASGHRARNNGLELQQN